MTRRSRTLPTLALAALLTLAAPAAARAGTDDGSSPADDGAGTSTSTTAGALPGDFAVTVNGRTYDPAAGRDAVVKDVAVTGRIAVRGEHVGFDVDPATLGVYAYTLTGAPDPQRMATRPTVVFTSKVPVLTAAQLRGTRLAELRVRDDVLVAQFTTASGGRLKVQAKDAPQGGVFQVEQEFGADVEFVHTLGPGLFYFTNPYTSKVNFGDGGTAVASGPDAHVLLIGKDSPQVARKSGQTSTATRWVVSSGGRMGGVLGEDAVELSLGATNCTSDCQAQNRVQGSLPVPPDPTGVTPL